MRCQLVGSVHGPANNRGKSFVWITTDLSDCRGSVRPDPQRILVQREQTAGFARTFSNPQHELIEFNT
jgi:hypothetical protein